MYYKILILLIILPVINSSLIKLKFLIDDPRESFHKIERKTGIPLSGGIYIFLSIIILSILNSNLLFNPRINFFLILILILGIFSDVKKDFSPKIRIIIQFIILVFFIYINNEIIINKTNIEFLDFIIQSDLAKFIFTLFCIITLLNGFNFMDGVNGLVSGYIISIIIILNLIFFKSTNMFYYNDLILVFFIFFLFNICGKSFLGDNGIYILSILVSFLVINILNKIPESSPIIAVSLLWYPAIENLFTIVRRLLNKKLAYLPDKLHLHSLIFRKLKLSIRFLPEKYKNTLTGLLINISLIPNFFFTYFFYDKSLYLGCIVLIYLFIYLFSYILLSKKLKIKT